jgi:mRNA interferase MazF
MGLRQYTVVLVNLNPSVGSEIQKTRPCVIISPDEMNKYLRTVVVAPMTTRMKRYPTRVAVKHGSKKGMIAIDQIRTIDKSRIVRVFEKLSITEIKRCKEVIRETFVD